MYPFDPHTYLYLLGRDRAERTARSEYRRLTSARKQLRRDEERLQRAWEELTRSLADVSNSERRVLELVRR